MDFKIDKSTQKIDLNRPSLTNNKNFCTISGVHSILLWGGFNKNNRYLFFSLHK
jgi:hypothetical protein